MSRYHQHGPAAAAVVLFLLLIAPAVGCESTSSFALDASTEDAGDFDLQSDAGETDLKFELDSAGLDASSVEKELAEPCSRSCAVASGLTCRNRRSVDECVELCVNIGDHCPSEALSLANCTAELPLSSFVCDPVLEVPVGSSTACMHEQSRWIACEAAYLGLEPKRFTDQK